MRAVYKHELSTYFTTMTGYIFCAFILLFAGIYTSVICLDQAFPEYEYVFGYMGFVFLIAVPVLTMRVMAEEKKQRTDQLLYSLPVSTTKIIFGKYLALLTVLAISTVISTLYVFIISRFGDVNLKAALGGAAGFFLIGAAYLAIGLFISSCTESQILAAGLSFVVLLVNYFLQQIAGMIDKSALVSFGTLIGVALLIALVVYLMVKNLAVAGSVGIVLVFATVICYMINPVWFEGLVPKILSKLCINAYHMDFMYASFNLTNVVFFLSVAAVFVFLSIQSLEKRRWS
ncbi:MAG: ABC transporter permease subunit [Lachnospiraceae bacterium]|nr:ABC transporter permease subunit [Lachnospiraceae bacterium]